MALGTGWVRLKYEMTDYWTGEPLEIDDKIFLATSRPPFGGCDGGSCARSCTCRSAAVTFGRGARRASRHMMRPSAKLPYDVRMTLENAQMTPGMTLAHVVKPDAWDRWLADLPESEKAQDGRSQDQIDMDNLRWRRAHEAKKRLVQFPPASESRTPGWLKAQEDAWIKSRK
jgi:hypothetical protein